ncbi:hypothetical protein TWF192_008437 [Orbilia oligospora]|uniref:Enoyl reductase (ER) domain-containing protein n=1 Tax=Orbilia oligospora TaxID=2813651 RepID=A0A6G1M4Q8_ORBOL|nr:hypothetical protein TWF191_002863 [Orbilia oligospora]KAF3242969.1 hypothetical protein TWF192_008437 [Orbilia oligospora]
MAGFATLLLAGQDLSERVNGIAQVRDALLSDVDNLFLPQTFRQTGSGIVEYCQLDEAAELTKRVQSVKAGPVLTTRKYGKWGFHTLPDDIVEVEDHAAGVNFKDCLIALGALNESTIGSEISGIVSQIGKDIQEHGLKPGDRVCGFAADGYRTLYRCKVSSPSRVPESSAPTDVEAASIPVNFATAWHVYYVARLVAGESVLIHSGSGGATVFATVSTQEKRDLLTSRYKIHPTHIFNSRDSNALWSVEIGKKDIQAQGKLPMAQFENNISFSAVDLGHMHQKRPQYIAQLINEVLERFGAAEKGLRPVSTVQTFDIS